MNDNVVTISFMGLALSAVIILMIDLGVDFNDLLLLIPTWGVR